MAEEVVDALLLSTVFDASGVEEQASRTIQALNQTLKQANASLPPLEIDTTQLLETLKAAGLDVSAFFAGMREEILAFNSATAGVAAGAGGGGGGPPNDPPDFSILAGQLQQLKPAAEGVTAAVAPMNAQLALATAESIKAAEVAALLAQKWGINTAAATSMTEAMSAAANAVHPMAREMSRASGTIEETSTALNTHSNSAKRAASALGILAAQSVGASGPIGQLAQTALIASGGLGQLAAAAVAVLAISKAYDLLTASQRKAKEEHEGLVAELQKRVQADVPQAAQEANSRGATRAEIATLEVQERQLRARQEFAEITGDIIGKMILQHRLEENLTKQKQLTLDLTKDQARAEAARLEEKQASSRDLISGLGLELATLRLGEDAVRRLTVANAAHTDSERTAALAILNQIIALNNLREAQKKAAEAAREHAQFLERLDAQFDQVRSASAQIRNDFDDGITKAWVDAREAAEDYFRNVQAGLDGLLTAEEIHQEWIENQRDAFRSVTDASAALVQTARDIGAIGDGAAQAALNALSLADALKEVTLTGASFGNIAGVISTGVGLLAGIGQALFGKDATQQEHAQIQASNDLVNALDRNTAAVLEARTPQGLSDTRNTLASLGDITPLLDIATKMPGLFGELGAGALDQALKDAGSSLEELSQIAEDNGITLLDSKGRLVAGSLEALDEKLRDAVVAATSFGDSLTEQSNAANLRSRIAGEDQDPAAKFARELATITAGDFSPAISQAFEGVDLSDKDAVRQRALELFDQFQSGFFTAHPELFGDISKDEFLGFLEDSADFLDSFNDSLDAATKSLTNVPDTFKLAAAEFSARAVDAPATPFPVGPLGNDPRTTGGSLRTTNSLGTAPSAVITGNTIEIKVTAPPGMSAADVARRVRVELEDGATAQFGLAAPGARE